MKIIYRHSKAEKISKLTVHLHSQLLQKYFHLQNKFIMSMTQLGQGVRSKGYTTLVQMPRQLNLNDMSLQREELSWYIYAQHVNLARPNYVILVHTRLYEVYLVKNAKYLLIPLFNVEISRLIPFWKGFLFLKMADY